MIAAPVMLLMRPQIHQYSEVNVPTAMTSNGVKRLVGTLTNFGTIAMILRRRDTRLKCPKTLNVFTHQMEENGLWLISSNPWMDYQQMTRVAMNCVKNSCWTQEKQVIIRLIAVNLIILKNKFLAFCILLPILEHKNSLSISVMVQALTQLQLS